MRISTKDFNFLVSKGRLTDRLESTTALSVINGPKSFFVASRLIAEVYEFLNIQVIQAKSKPMCVAMIWLRVKVNRTRLWTAAHFARNEIKYQKSRESGLFQYILYTCTIACLSFIPLYKQTFYKCYSSPSQKSKESKKLPWPVSVTKRKSFKTFRYSSRDKKGRPRSRGVRLRIILAFHIALIYYTQDFRVYEGTRDQPIPGPFPAPPFF